MNAAPPLWTELPRSYNASAMIEPGTLKALGEYSGKAWSVVGPLVGVLVGALLGRSWDRQKWLNDNVKQECQELLGAITKSATQILADAGRKSWDTYLDALIAFHTRIFIAEEVEREKLLDLWAHAVHDFGEGRDRHKFDDAIEKIRSAIVRMAIRRN